MPTSSERRDDGHTLVVVVAAVAILGIAIVAAFPPVASHYMMREMVQDNPHLAWQPAPLPSGPALDAKPFKLTCFDIEFDVPWKPEKPDGAWSPNHDFFVFTLVAGREIRFTRPETAVDRFAAAENVDHGAKESMQRRYGFEPVPTRYDAMDLVLRHQPGPVGLFAYRRMMGEVWLVGSKRVALAPHPNGVFLFETSLGRGFQINDPARSEEVRIHYFDGDDTHHDMAIRGDQDTPITQAEINFIVRSIRPAREEAAKPTKPTALPRKLAKLAS